MSTESCNCTICAQEFNSEELQSVALLEINVTNFKICQACLDSSNPADDYREVREIVNSYLKFAEAHSLFNEVQDILNSNKNN
jgi:hypothetical protein